MSILIPTCSSKGPRTPSLAALAYVMRGKDYQLLKRADVQARLHLPEDQHLTHPKSGICRALYDCPDLTRGPIAQNPPGRDRDPSGKRDEESGRCDPLRRCL